MVLWAQENTTRHHTLSIPIFLLCHLGMIRQEIFISMMIFQQILTRSICMYSFIFDNNHIINGMAVDKKVSIQLQKIVSVEDLQ